MQLNAAAINYGAHAPGICGHRWTRDAYGHGALVVCAGQVVKPSGQKIRVAVARTLRSGLATANAMAAWWRARIASTDRALGWRARRQHADESDAVNLKLMGIPLGPADLTKLKQYAKAVSVATGVPSRTIR